LGSFGCNSSWELRLSRGFQGSWVILKRCQKQKSLDLVSRSDLVIEKNDETWGYLGVNQHHLTRCSNTSIPTPTTWGYLIVLQLVLSRNRRVHGAEYQTNSLNQKRTLHKPHITIEFQRWNAIKYDEGITTMLWKNMTI
jgi:hypothetical protein